MNLDSELRNFFAINNDFENFSDEERRKIRDLYSVWYCKEMRLNKPCNREWTALENYIKTKHYEKQEKENIGNEEMPTPHNQDQADSAC